MSKIVVLNSGGFDSVVLMNYLTFLVEEDFEIHSLHFLYGALNQKQQELCVDRVCEKCGAVNKKIELPAFNWSNSNFFSNKDYSYNSQYLEYRNLIFLSYALSYAQSIGADSIIVATLKSGEYPDTNPVFFEGLNSFSKPLTNIEIITPFANYDKMDLIPFATLTGINVGDYWSCDKPTETGEPCNECLDCESLEEINTVLELNHPFKALYQSGFNYSDEKFIEILGKSPKEREVRALINNDCQLNCKHCFYGFKEMTSKKVDREVYYNVLKDLICKYGFNHIHFAGKEPLIGDVLEYYAKRLTEEKVPCSFDVVTNGILIPQKVESLKNCGLSKVFLSIDDVLDTNGVRNIHNTTDKALKACEKCEMPVEVFIDLHQNNYNKVSDIILYLMDHYSIGSFYVRTIRSLGNAKEQSLLTGDNLYAVFKQLRSLALSNGDKNFTFNLSSEYIPVVRENKEFSDLFNIMDNLYTTFFLSNFKLYLERFCSRYFDVTLTPDGYVLGCASEVALKDYAKYSAGNICEEPLDVILKRGNDLRVKCAGKFKDCNYTCMVNKF